MRKFFLPEELPKNGGSLPPSLDQSVPVELGHHVGLHHVHGTEHNNNIKQRIIHYKWNLDKVAS